MAQESVSVEKPPKETRNIPCRRCNVRTNHKVLTSVKYSWSAEDYDIQGIDLYEVVSCLGCGSLSFRKSSSNSEDYEEDDEGNIFHPEHEEIYPNRITGRAPIEETYYLPEKIKNIYTETHSALSAKLKILAGVGIRALVEAICGEEKAEGSDLKKKIDNLVARGVLTASNAETLHQTRFLGNRSAHEVEAAKDAELSIAFDILENLLGTIYIIPKKAKALRFDPF